MMKKMGIVLILMCMMAMMSINLVSAKSYTYTYDIYSGEHIFGAVGFTWSNKDRNSKNPFWYNKGTGSGTEWVSSDDVTRGSGICQVFNDKTEKWEYKYGYNSDETAMIAWVLLHYDHDHCWFMEYNDPSWIKNGWSNTVKFMWTAYPGDEDRTIRIEIDSGVPGGDHDFFVYKLHKEGRK